MTIRPVPGGLDHTTGTLMGLETTMPHAEHIHRAEQADELIEESWTVAISGEAWLDATDDYRKRLREGIPTGYCPVCRSSVLEPERPVVFPDGTSGHYACGYGTSMGPADTVAEARGER